MTRTPKQAEADRLALETLRLAEDYYRFAADFEERPIREAASIISSLRTRIRQHMHPEDRKETAA